MSGAVCALYARAATGMCWRSGLDMMVLSTPLFRSGECPLAGNQRSRSLRLGR